MHDFLCSIEQLPKIYKDASHFWPFNEMGDGLSPDVIGDKPAVLLEGAVISSSPTRGNILDTMSVPLGWVDLGDFKGIVIVMIEK